jgi:ubiquinone/menaquinone biosynthesis C-methylase UbiE
MTGSSESMDALPEEAMRHYAEVFDESQRLVHPSGQLELARSQELLLRYLQPPPATVLDVGGGTGIYSFWLARAGYQVYLIDAMPSHIEQAQRAQEAQPDHPLAGVAVGDARHLEWSDKSADAVLLFGPLYHLTEREDRLRALREARRVLRPGGVVLAAGISRFASAFDGLWRDFLDDPVFQGIVRKDLTDGQHRNPTNHPHYFTTTYFHHPSELKSEIEEAGLRHEATLAIEGPGWLLPDFDAHWNDSVRRERLLEIVRRIEAEPSLLGASAHLMAIGRRHEEL